MSKNKKGISLIVLVITVIIMIILIGAIVLSINNQRVTQRADTAVKEHNLEEVQTLAELAWSEAYMNGIRDGVEIEEHILQHLKKEDVDVAQYNIVSSKDGVIVTKRGKTLRWTQLGTEVTNGIQTLEVGDEISYVAEGSDYLGKWAILGANENGELLITSAEVVGNLSTGRDSGQVITAANNACKVYDKGQGAIAARSVRIEDINRITGYDPKNTGNGKPYGEGTIYEYGLDVTYYWVGNNQIMCEATNGKTDNDTEMFFNNGLIQYNEETDTSEYLPISTTATKDNPEKITTITNTSYYYYPTTLTTTNTGDVKGLKPDSKAYKLLFRTSSDVENTEYIISSVSVQSTGSYGARYFIHMVRDGKVGDYLYMRSNYSHASIDVPLTFEDLLIPKSLPLRPVVTLSSEVLVTGDSENGWRINIT